MIGRLRRLGMLDVLPIVPQAVPLLHAQSDEDFDFYKVRVGAVLFYSNSSGNVQDSNDTISVDLQADL